MTAAPSLDELERGVRAAERRHLARAITLIESTNPGKAAQGQELLRRLLPDTGGALRVGITGAPGVGKSTFVEALGTRLADAGRKVAVLAVDPSSTLSRGSILGDKARMERLAQHRNAYVRPSPSAATLGGVARRTREALLACEAAGFDVVFVETVGVGQSETAVADLVDCFLVLLLPGAGDELQGIKKGVLELADLVAVNKCDGDRVEAAREARREVAAALRFARPVHAGWTPEALCVSARTGEGLDELWAAIERHRATLEGSGELARARNEQLRRWMWSLVDERLRADFDASDAVRALRADTEAAVLARSLTPTQGAERLLAAFEGR